MAKTWIHACQHVDPKDESRVKKPCGKKAKFCFKDPDSGEAVYVCGIHRRVHDNGEVTFKYI